MFPDMLPDIHRTSPDMLSAMTGHDRTVSRSSMSKMSSLKPDIPDTNRTRTGHESDTFILRNVAHTAYA